MKKCPVCGVENDDDWPLDIDGMIEDGGCQTCWEAGADHTRKWKNKQLFLYERSKWFRGGGASFHEYRALREMNEQ